MNTRKSSKKQIVQLEEQLDAIKSWAEYWSSYTHKDMTVRELGYRDAAIEIRKKLSK